MVVGVHQDVEFLEVAVEDLPGGQEGDTLDDLLGSGEQLLFAPVLAGHHQVVLVVLHVQFLLLGRHEVARDPRVLLAPDELQQVYFVLEAVVFLHVALEHLLHQQSPAQLLLPLSLLHTRLGWVLEGDWGFVLDAH